MLPTVRQMLQAMSSLNTNGVDARSIQVVPPMSVAIRTPKPVASALTHDGVATNEVANSPQQQRSEESRQQPREKLSRTR